MRVRFAANRYSRSKRKRATDYDYRTITDDCTGESVASSDPGQTPSSELGNLEAKVRPSVIWVTTFDSKGNLLRTESGFFISPDGRFVTTAHAIEGGVNAVAKTADGGIYNVSGVLTVSKSADLAVLKAEIKPQKLLRFLDLNKTGELSAGARVAVVGSALAGNEGARAKRPSLRNRPIDWKLRGQLPRVRLGRRS